MAIPLEITAFNRMGLGPQLGDVQRVRAMGFAAYVEEQLAPHDADDTGAAIGRRTAFRGLPRPQTVRALESVQRRRRQDGSGLNGRTGIVEKLLNGINLINHENATKRSHGLCK